MWLTRKGTLKIKLGRLAERRLYRRRAGKPWATFAWSRSLANGGGLVGCGAGFSLWLRKVERCVAVDKAVVKCALTWSAGGEAAG